MLSGDTLSVLIDRVAVRNRLLRIPILSQRRRRAQADRQAAFIPPSLSAAALALVESVREKAAHVGNIVDLLGAGSMVLDQLGGGALGQTLDDLGKDLVESEEIFNLWPAVYLLGLEETMLDMAEIYLGEPCYYLGISIKRERVNLVEKGTRQWHMDIEDDRMLRFLVYLSDVDEGSGPFNYVPAAQSAAAREAMNYRAGYVGDEAFSGFVALPDRRAATGKVGTVAAFDGTRVFHRASPPTEHERLSLSITYCSRHPRQILRPVRLRKTTRRRLLAGLSDRQRACIPLGRLA
jgi:hypothetical protein